MTASDGSSIELDGPGVFQSKAPKLGLVTAFDGMRGVGVIMTGMGQDGAQGLLRLRFHAGRKAVEEGWRLCCQPVAALHEAGRAADQHQ